jgi:hypothetical protein
MQILRGIAAGTVVAIPLAIFILWWLSGVLLIAIFIAGGVGVGAAIIVGTRTDTTDIAADEAWRAAAPDLPPVSDRAAMEKRQVSMSGPGKSRKAARHFGAGE